MKWEVLIAHADGDEKIAERIAERLFQEGYQVQCRAFTLVGESILGRENQSLQSNGPVVLCGTRNTVGSASVASLISAARYAGSSNGLRIFPVKIDKDVDIARIALPDTQVADSTIDFERGMRELVGSLKKHFPLDTSSPTNVEIDQSPPSYLETPAIGEQSDFEAIKRFRSELRPDVRLSFPAEMAELQFLKAAGITRSGNLTRAGVLMFGVNPQAAIPQSVCHFTVYHGVDRSAEMEPLKIFGVIPDQIKKITDLIAGRIRRREQFDPGSNEIAMNYEYPTVSLREVIANALVHRSYEIADRKVHVRLFRDRIEVINPGAWNGPTEPRDDGTPVGIDKLVSDSVNKNERLASLLSWTRLVEGEGSGLPKSVEECRRIGVRIPVAKQKDGFVSVTIYPIPHWDRTQARARIYISAEASEFGKLRDKVAADLRARGYTVVNPSDFRQNPESETLLGSIAEYIRDCTAVICIVGKHSGACPPLRAAESFPGVLPDGIQLASFAQWEFYFARHYKRRAYIYVARDDYKPDRHRASSESADLQSAYLQFLKAEGVHYATFSEPNELRVAVLRDDPNVTQEPVPANRPATKAIVLPYPSIGSLFRGRDEFMGQLHGSLTRGRGARTAIVSQALYGLGGIGKTRVAVEYAWAHADDYNALLFVVAETPETLRRNLAMLAATLVPQLDTTDDAARLAAVLDWLKANLGWFLILDNVDSRPALAEVERLLSGLAGGHVVIASRLADFSGNFQPLELDVLAVEDAADFLLARTEGRWRAAPDDVAKAREVAEELGRLALALEQAAAFIAKRRLTFAQYLEQWRSNRAEILAWFDKTITDYPRSVAVTWQTSVAQLSEGSRRLLERLAWLAPEKVPESLLDVSVPGAEAENLRDAYDDLAAYSLVTRAAEGPFFLVNRLVQEVTRRSLTGDMRRRSLVEALRWIGAAFSGDPQDVRNWPVLDPLAPHAHAVTAYADNADILEPTARLMNELGLLLHEKALHAEAEPLMRRALAIDENSFGPEHPDVATSLNNLAQLQQATNRLAEAEPLYRRALAIDEKSFGPDHPKVATDLNSLVGLLQATNRLSEAEPLMRRGLAIDETSFGPDHPNVARSLNNLALVLKATKRLAEAEPLMRRAAAIDEKSFGPDHPNVAISLNNLASLLRATNRLSEAEPLMRRAVAIDEKSFGPDHPKVATSLNNLGRLLQATNRLAEAEPLYRRALAIDEKTFGPDHPEVATDLNNLAQLLQATNRLAEAEPLMRRDVRILVEFTRRTGHPHPYLDDAFASYGGLLADLGKTKAEIEAARAELMQPLTGDLSS